MDIQRLLPVARSAGSAIMRVYEREFEVERKADRSPLTEADRAAHRIIAGRLADEYPMIPVMSEESTNLASYDVRRHWDRYWLVDPLDGTKEFIKRNGQFTVNIALVERGRPVAGVVHAPARDWMYWGTEGSGAWKASGSGGAEPIECASATASGCLRVVGSNSHMTPATERFIRGLKETHGEISFVPMGSSLKICLIAEGAADLYPRMAPTMEWDTAAAHAVLNAAGGTLVGHGTDEELKYNKPDLRNGWFVAKPRTSGNSEEGRRV